MPSSGGLPGDVSFPPRVRLSGSPDTFGAPCKRGGHGRRWIGRAEAGDFLHWGPIEPIIWPRLDDPPDYDFYLNGRSEYPGLPEWHLIFPMVYHRSTERSEIRLYSSADGIAWSELPGGPILEPRKPGSWDSEFLGNGKDLVPFGGDRAGVPHSGTPYPHK